MTPAHITRLITFAQHGQPANYAASDLMRADLQAVLMARISQLPVGEIVIEDMGRPFNAKQVRVHFYDKVPKPGTQIFTEQKGSS